GFCYPGKGALGAQALAQHGYRLLGFVREFLDKALFADERSHRAFNTDGCEQAGLQRIAYRVTAIEAFPHREVAARIEIARFDLVTREVRDDGHRECLLHL